MIDNCYVDCETCGFHGLAVTMQYAINNGPVEIHEVWKSPIKETLDLIRRICTMNVIGFNLAFDWFHIQKLENVLSLYVKKHGPGSENHFPEDHIDELGELEIEARDGNCVKPASALDMMLHFRKTELQITMERSDVRIRRVPSLLATDLAKLLTKRIRLDPILFANQKKWAPAFRVFPIKDDEGNEHPDLKDIVLKFRPGGGLKALATHVLHLKTTDFVEVELDKHFRPKELGYAPFARCLGRTGNWKWTWPEVIQYHIDHWAYNPAARQYAADDVIYTRLLHRHAGSPVGGDEDSLLACCVASCRWKGYKIDLEKLDKIIQEYKERLKAPIAPNAVKDWINEVLQPLERLIVWRKGTNKKALKALVKEWAEENPEASRRAKAVLDARAAKKKIEVLQKLQKAGRFHASFKVIGALSGRMSGADKLNAQGIDKTKEVRGAFPLAFSEFTERLLGGDMMSFEIGIAEADYGDPNLRRDLLTCEECDSICEVSDGRIRCNKCIRKYEVDFGAGKCTRCGLGFALDVKKEPFCGRCAGANTKKFHALYGASFFPELGYLGILATAGLKTGNKYNDCKIGAFSTLYGAQPKKIAEGLGVAEEIAQEGFHRFWRTYPVAGRKRREVEWDFTSLYSPENSNKILYKQPKDFIESLLGYKRFFTLENYIIKELFTLATDIPKPWTKIKVKLTRSKLKGEQSVGSAARSALYGCAFGMQAMVTRQAQNHRIQSTGAGITKQIQCTVWEFQPAGIGPWQVRPFQVHDEIQCPTNPAIIGEVEKAVHAKVEEFRAVVPLIGIDFGRLNSWADK